jgi:DNA-directed RNA polymerase subunit RPC12/RpoP
MSTEPPPVTPYQPPSGPGSGEPSPVEAFRCPNCGSTQFNPGFVDDTANGIVRWIQGPIEWGLLGGLRRAGRQHRVIVSYRCTGCSRLELYAGEET